MIAVVAKGNRGLETQDIPDVVDADSGRHLTKAMYYRKFRASAFLEPERTVA